MRWLRKLERLLLICGLLMIAVYVTASIDGTVLSRAELRRFNSQQLASANEPQRIDLPTAAPNFSLWSKYRIKNYEESLAAHFAPAIGILFIPKIHVEVPVLEGTDDLTLNRGVGHITGTANPGENGNVAIAGHRDGFFRGLKDVSLGDTIRMVSMQGTENYVIDSITIVERGDVSVLQQRGHASLTLITCYPFYFVGNAPKRYVVHASVADSAPSNPHATQRTRPSGFDQQANAR
jgi:sortase A